METLNRLKDLKSISESFEKSLEDDLTNYSIWFLIFTYLKSLPLKCNGARLFNSRCGFSPWKILLLT